MKRIDTLHKELEALKIKQEMILKKNEEIVSKQHEVEELKTDYALEGKSTTALENKMYKLIDKEAENLEAQKEISRLIKNLTQRISKREKIGGDGKISAPQEAQEPASEAVREKFEGLTEKTDAMLAVKKYLEFVVSDTVHASNSDLRNATYNLFYMNDITAFSKKEVRDIYLAFPKDDVIKPLFSLAYPEKYNSDDFSNMPNKYNLKCDYESNNLRGLAGAVEDLADLYGKALTELGNLIPDLDLNKPDEIKDKVLRAVSVESVADIAAEAGGASEDAVSANLRELSEDKSTHKDLV